MPSYIRSKTRKSRYSPIQKVSVEMWNACWINLQDEDLNRDSICALTLTCKLFYDLCQPLLFQELSARAPPAQDEDTAAFALLEESRRLCFLATDSSARLRMMVKLWSFSGRMFNYDRYLGYPETPDMGVVPSNSNEITAFFMHNLQHYPSLRTVKLDMIAVDTRILNILASLPALEVLRLDQCPYHADTVPQLRLREFSTINLAGIPLDDTLFATPPQALISGATIQSLQLSNDVSVHLFLRPLFKAGVMERLTDLDISLYPEVQAGFFEFLLSCPQLRSLTVYVDSTTMTRGDRFPAGTLPLLESFEGAYQIAEMFPDDLPLETLILTNYEQLAHFEESDAIAESEPIFQLLQRMQRLPSTLSYLRLPLMTPNFDMLAMMASSFTQLKDLTLHLLCVPKPTASPSHTSPTTYASDNEAGAIGVEARDHRRKRPESFFVSN